MTPTVIPNVTVTNEGTRRELRATLNSHTGLTGHFFMREVSGWRVDDPAESFSVATISLANFSPPLPDGLPSGSRLGLPPEWAELPAPGMPGDRLFARIAWDVRLPAPAEADPDPKPTAQPHQIECYLADAAWVYSADGSIKDRLTSLPPQVGAWMFERVALCLGIPVQRRLITFRPVSQEIELLEVLPILISESLRLECEVQIRRDTVSTARKIIGLLCDPALPHVV